jgi:hypothetical protein
VAYDRWYDGGLYKVCEKVYGGIYNMWPVIDGMMEALTMNMNETFIRVYLIAGL